METNKVYIRLLDDHGYNIENMSGKIDEIERHEYDNKEFILSPFYFYISTYKNGSYCRVNLKIALTQLRKHSTITNVYISHTTYHLNIVDYENDFVDICCKTIYLAFQEQEKIIYKLYKEKIYIPSLSGIKSHFNNSNQEFDKLLSLLG